MARYLIQQHGEWSENGEMDLDFEAETAEEARRIITEEIPRDTIYIIFDHGDTPDDGIVCEDRAPHVPEFLTEQGEWIALLNAARR